MTRVHSPAVSQEPNRLPRTNGAHNSSSSPTPQPPLPVTLPLPYNYYTLSSYKYKIPSRPSVNNLLPPLNLLRQKKEKKTSLVLCEKKTHTRRDLDSCVRIWLLLERKWIGSRGRGVQKKMRRYRNWFKNMVQETGH